MASASLEFTLGAVLLGLISVALGLYVRNRQGRAEVEVPAPEGEEPTKPQTRKVNREFLTFLEEYVPVCLQAADLFDRAKAALSPADIQEINDLYFKAHYSLETIRQLKILLSTKTQQASDILPIIRSNQASLDALMPRLQRVPLRYQPYISTSMRSIQSADAKCTKAIGDFLTFVDLLSKRVDEIERTGLGPTNQMGSDGLPTSEGESYINTKKAVYYTSIMESLEDGERFLNSGLSGLEKLKQL